jgi:GR25 family glycosyltransferase involved in LPS biosynthesis
MNVQMNNIVDNIYVINMKKDKDRLNKFQAQVGDKFKYQIVEGIDCDLPEYNDQFEAWKYTNPTCEDVTFENFDWQFYLNKYSDLSPNITTKKGAWKHWIDYGMHELRTCVPNQIVNKGQFGCLQSHINILKDALEKNYETILILEDDVIFSKEAQKQFERITKIQSTRPNWNIIYLGASQHNWKNIKMKDDFYYAQLTTGSFAYIVRMSFYQILLNEFEKRLKPVDNYLIDIQKTYYKSLFVMFPNIMICNLEESNIGLNRNQKVFSNKFKWSLEEYNIIQ